MGTSTERSSGSKKLTQEQKERLQSCLLYTSDAADEL